MASSKRCRFSPMPPLFAAGTSPSPSPSAVGMGACPKLPPNTWLAVIIFLGQTSLAEIGRLSRFLASLVHDHGAWKAAVLRRLLSKRGAGVDVELDFELTWRCTLSGILKSSPASTISRRHRQNLRGLAKEAWAFVVSSLATHPPSGGLSCLSWAPPFTGTNAPIRDTKKPAWLRIVGGLANFFGKCQHKAWRAGGLRRLYSSRKFTTALPGSGTCFKMRLDSFWRYMETNVDFTPPHWDAEPLYLFEPRPPLSLRALLVTPPLSLAVDLTRACPEFQKVIHSATHGWLLLGGVGSGSRFHVDAFGCGAWSACIQGRKRWVLYPPDHGIPPGVTCPQAGRYASPCPVFWFTEILPILAPEQCPVVDIILNAGEIIYIPPGWWHCVLNLDTPTVAFTRNVAYGIDSARCAAEALDAAGETLAANALRMYAWQWHMDN